MTHPADTRAVPLALLEEAEAIVRSGSNTTYPSRNSAQYVRNVMAALIVQLKLAIESDPPALNWVTLHDACKQLAVLREQRLTPELQGEMIESVFKAVMVFAASEPALKLVPTLKAVEE